MVWANEAFPAIITKDGLPRPSAPGGTEYSADDEEKPAVPCPVAGRDELLEAATAEILMK